MCLNNGWGKLLLNSSANCIISAQVTPKSMRPMHVVKRFTGKFLEGSHNKHNFGERRSVRTGLSVERSLSFLEAEATKPRLLLRILSQGGTPLKINMENYRTIYYIMNCLRNCMWRLQNWNSRVLWKSRKVNNLDSHFLRHLYMLFWWIDHDFW